MDRRRNTVHVLSLIAVGRAQVWSPGPAATAEAGDLLLMPSGIDHRYASTDTRGWQALWITFDGIDLEGLGLRGGVLPGSGAVRDQMVRLAQAVPGCGAPRAAAALAAILAELASVPPTRRADAAAEAVIAQVRADPVSLPSWSSLAKRQGLSWSALRQAIRRRSGLAPEHLRLQARLERAATALADGATVSAAASIGGWQDPFYFSRQFSRAYGMAPRRWSRDGAAY